MRLHYWWLIAALAISGCGSSQGPVDPHTGLTAKDRVMNSPRGRPMVAFSEDDPGLAKAVAEARKELPRFIDRLQHKKASEKFQVKLGLPTSQGTLEHIWMDNVTYSNGVFKGRLNDEPVDIPGKHFGDEVSVAAKDVEDWSIGDAKTGTRVDGEFSKAALDKVEFAASAKP